MTKRDDWTNQGELVNPNYYYVTGFASNPDRILRDGAVLTNEIGRASCRERV